MAGEGSGVPAVRVHRSGDRAAVRDAVPAAGCVAGVMGAGMCGWSCRLELDGRRRRIRRGG